MPRRKPEPNLPFPRLRGLSGGLAGGEPRLWVRRLVIWHDMQSAPFRDVPLRRGLNVVWSPSSGDAEEQATGHAAGKTLFCRLLRYCLGEIGFADDDDTAAIRQRFPDGGVGAEVRLRGESWAVRRRFAPKRDDRAARVDRVEDLDDPASRDTFAAFASLLADSLCDDEAKSLLAGRIGSEDAWRFVLAWLTRDQECRVDGLTHWRHQDSSSNSPVRSSAVEDRTRVLRVLLGLYAPEVRQLEDAVAAAEAALLRAKNEARLAGDRFEALRDEVAMACELDREAVWPGPGYMQDERRAVDEVRRILTERIDGKLGSALVPTATPEDLRGEQEREHVAVELEHLQHEHDALAADVDALRQQRSLLQVDHATRWQQVVDAKHPLCPFDGTPLNVEAARFVCPLPRLPDVLAAEQVERDAADRLRQIEEKVAEGMRRIGALADMRARLTERLRTLRLRADARERDLALAKREGQAAWAAKGLISRLFEQREVVVKVEQATAQADSKQDALSKRLSEALAASSATEVQRSFDDLVKRIVAPEAEGRIKVGAKGLQPTIEWRGARRSVALDSLKIVLFDLAAMLCAVDGHSHGPAFLVHDSPREGDLDQWTYRRIFQAMLELGPDEDTAPFQYIVTTTTDPPEGPVRARVRLPLSTSMPSKRLLGVDLL